MPHDDQSFNLGGGSEQVRLLLEALRLAQEGRLGQYGVGQRLLEQLQSIQQNPFSIVPAMQAYGLAGGGTLAPAVDLAAGGGLGRASPYGSIVDQLIRGLSDFALGNLESPELPPDLIGLIGSYMPGSGEPHPTGPHEHLPGVNPITGLPPVYPPPIQPGDPGFPQRSEIEAYWDVFYGYEDQGMGEAEIIARIGTPPGPPPPGYIRPSPGPFAPQPPPTNYVPVIEPPLEHYEEKRRSTRRSVSSAKRGFGTTTTLADIFRAGKAT